jgi:hypothetical protein
VRLEPACSDGASVRSEMKRMVYSIVLLAIAGTSSWAKIAVVFRLDTHRIASDIAAHRSKLWIAMPVRGEVWHVAITSAKGISHQLSDSQNLRRQCAVMYGLHH